MVYLQAVLGGISLSAPEYKSADSQPALDALSIFRHCSRIARGQTIFLSLEDHH